MLHRVSWISWISITSSHFCSHQSPTLRHAHSWERGTLGTQQKEKPNGLLLRLLRYQLEAFIPMHGLFSDCTLLVLAVARNSQKNLIVVDLLVRNNFQERRETLKSN